jgi:long-chain acyl-CoA synthetase
LGETAFHDAPGGDGPGPVRPWLASYPPGVPAEVALDAYDSLADLLAQSVARYGGHTAYHQFGVDLTYRALDERSASLAAYFQHDLGLQPGDRIALMLPNVIQYPIALFAALRAGLVVVNVNPLYTAPELVRLVEDAAPRAIVVLETFAATVQRALQSVAIEAVIVAAIADLQRFPRSLLMDYVVRHRRKLVPPWQIPGALRFRQVVRARATATFRAPALNRETVAFLQYTGGTTGLPKGAVLTHGNMLAEAVIFGTWLRDVYRPGQETVLIAMPLYHVAALACQFMVSVLHGARAVLVSNPRDIPAMVRDFATHRPTVFAGLNTLFNALLNHPEFAKLDFSQLRGTGAGGTATQPAVAERWQAVTGTTVIEIYGLSETAGAAIANPPGGARFDGTIGVPLPSVTVEIRDEAGRRLPPGAAGEICIRGPMVMRGYYNRPEETAAVLGADGFLATGDIGVMAPDGVLRIVDRKKDMVLVSGFNVYPTEVEEVLFRHPGILEAAVVGLPDAQSGEVPVACVVRRDAALTEAAVIAHARANLAAYKLPRRVVFVDALPKTPVGKVLRRDLRARLTE